MNMFEQATRNKLRFNSVAGLLSVEDLWDIKLYASSSKTPTLDAIYKDLNIQLKNEEEDSLVSTASKRKCELQLQLDIVKHIATVRMQEVKERENAIAQKQKRDRIRGIMAKKQDEELAGKSVEELRSMLEGM